VRTLDLSLLAFARMQLKDEAPSWYLVGNKCFSEHAEKLTVAPAYVALRGYTVGLKCCLAGLTLVSDMTVSVFLAGGPLVNVVSQALDFPSFDAFVSDARRRGVDPRDYPLLNKMLKNCKIRLDHLVSADLRVGGRSACLALQWRVLLCISMPIAHCDPSPSVPPRATRASSRSLAPLPTTWTPPSRGTGNA
jgi:hypothetical protein